VYVYCTYKVGSATTAVIGKHSTNKKERKQHESEMDVKQMKAAHAAAIVCRNWKIQSSAIKRPGHLLLEFWHTSTSFSKANANDGAVTSYSPNFSQTFKQQRQDIVRFFLFDNEYHFITANGQVFYCAFATRYQPGNGKINAHTQLLRKDMAEIVANSKIIDMRFRKPN
jgi:hypothetical protein